MSPAQIKRLYLRSRRIHNLTKNEFYSLTPREYYQLEKDYQDEQQRREEAACRRTARVCAILCELQRDTKRRHRPYTEEDFMPQPARQAPEVLAERLRALAAAQKFNFRKVS